MILLLLSLSLPVLSSSRASIRTCFIDVTEEPLLGPELSNSSFEMSILRFKYWMNCLIFSSKKATFFWSHKILGSFCNIQYFAQICYGGAKTRIWYLKCLSVFLMVCRLCNNHCHSFQELESRMAQKHNYRVRSVTWNNAVPLSLA